MNDGPVSQSNVMVETTDSLEAVGVFRGWKNIFFMVVLVCLLVTQAAFWLVDLGVVEVAETPQATVDTPQADPIEAAAESVTAPESAPTTEATPTPESVTVTESSRITKKPLTIIFRNAIVVKISFTTSISHGQPNHARSRRIVGDFRCAAEHEGLGAQGCRVHSQCAA